MIVLVVPFVILIALIVGAVILFRDLSPYWGPLGASAALVVIALVLVIAVAAVIRARRLPGRIKGEPGVYVLSGAWGELRFIAPKRIVRLRVGERSGEYLFADLRTARASGSHLLLELADARQPQWEIPLASSAEARRWQRVAEAAIAQRL